MEAASVLVGAGLVAVVARGRAAVNAARIRYAAEQQAQVEASQVRAARLTRELQARRPRSVQELVEAGQVDWAGLLSEGRLRQVGPAVPDPGNPPHVLVLVEDTTGSMPGVRILIVTNPVPDSAGHLERIGLTVPDHISHPLAAAASTYADPTHPLDMTPEDYAGAGPRA